MPKIKGVLTRVYSFRDRYGNCYNAVRYVDTASGHCVKGTICGDNSGLVPRLLYPVNTWQSILYQDQGMGYRDFMRLTKNWPHWGSQPEEIAECIKRALKEEKKQARKAKQS